MRRHDEIVVFDVLLCGSAATATTRACWATLRAMEDYTNKYKVRVFMRVCAAY